MEECLRSKNQLTEQLLCTAAQRSDQLRPLMCCSNSMQTSMPQMSCTRLLSMWLASTEMWSSVNSYWVIKPGSSVLMAARSAGGSSRWSRNGVRTTVRSTFSESENSRSFSLRKTWLHPKWSRSRKRPPKIRTYLILRQIALWALILSWKGASSRWMAPCSTLRPTENSDRNKGRLAKSQKWRISSA